MQRSEAAGFLAMLMALSPFPAIPESTQTFWVGLLSGYELHDAQAALEEYGLGAFRNRIDQLDIERITGAIRSKRDQRAGTQPALEEGEGITLEEARRRDPELDRRYKALKGRIGLPMPTLPKMTRAEVEAEGQLEPKREPSAYRSSACSGIGKPVVMRDGVPYCPDCGQNLDPDWVPGREHA